MYTLINFESPSLSRDSTNQVCRTILQIPKRLYKVFRDLQMVGDWPIHFCKARTPMYASSEHWPSPSRPTKIGKDSATASHYQNWPAFKGFSGRDRRITPASETCRMVDSPCQGGRECSGIKETVHCINRSLFETFYIFEPVRAPSDSFFSWGTASRTRSSV